jgi:hypothetical protein
VTTLAANPVVIAGDQALAAFRQGLTGPYALQLLGQAGGRLLVQLPVGAGKTAWLLRIIEHALTHSARHDLVLVLVPRWDILHELLARLPAGLPRLVLRPRPRQRCGPLDADWLQYEQTGCGSLGREELCGGCPRFARCPWPGQYGRRLRGARLILATQQHLVVNPLFVTQLCRHARARRPLVLLDESDLLLRATDRTLLALDLDRFVTAQEYVLAGVVGARAGMRQWLELSRLVAQAPTGDLREGRWQFPGVHADWATAVQRAGRQLFGPAFRFLGHDLHNLAHSDPTSRERLGTGDVRFATLPYLGPEFVIFSGSMAPALARYRLDPNHARPTVVSPFEGHRFEHPQTRWFNLNTLDGAAKFFPHNAGRMLDFFAALLARNVAAGKRTLLVSRKKFLGRCRLYLRRRLAELGAGPVNIVAGDWQRHDLADPRTVPLISYGVAGLNRFEQCEAAYCLNSFYVAAATVARAAQDIDPSADRYPVRIDFTGQPRRREARVELPDGRETILPRIVQAVLEEKEANVVVQAVGRVRPFTRPREVITVQAGALPGVRYALEFRSLKQARAFFGVACGKAAEVKAQAAEARRLKVLGRTRAEIAAALGVSPSTVKRYLRREGGQKPSY